MNKKRSKVVISYNMSRIRSKGTSIEKLFASALRKERIKFRRYFPICGKPDFVLYPCEIAVFCDSSFWHGYKSMKTARHRFKRNKSFWINKISRNIERDSEVNKYLKNHGWKVIRFWDFEIKKDIEKCIGKIRKIIQEQK